MPMPRKQRRWVFALLLCLPLAALALGGDFTLTDHDGQPWSLRQARGKVVLIQFGYTHCPDICPLNLAHTAAVLRALGKDADRVQALFISVDPQRDTPARLKQFVHYFSPRILGLTGNIAQLEKMTNAYGAYFSYPDGTIGDDYLVEHSGSLYVVDPDGDFDSFMPRSLPVVRVVGEVRDLIE